MISTLGSACSLASAALFAALGLSMAAAPPDSCHMEVRISAFDKRCNANSSCAPPGNCTIRTDTATLTGFTIYFCGCANGQRHGPDTTGDKCQTVVIEDVNGVQMMVCYDHSCGVTGSRGIEMSSASDADCKRDVTSSPETYAKRCSCP